MLCSRIGQGPVSPGLALSLLRMELRVGFLMRTHHTRAPQHGLLIRAHRSRKPMGIMPELLIQIKDPSMIQTIGLVEMAREGLLTLVAEAPRSGGLDLPAPQEAEPPPMAVATQGMALPGHPDEAALGVLREKFLAVLLLEGIDRNLLVVGDTFLHALLPVADEVIRYDATREALRGTPPWPGHASSHPL